MSEKVYENVFRFSLYQGNNVICEKVFTADKFNPVSRYSVDIREIIPSIVTRLQRTLSQKFYETTFYHDKRDDDGLLYSEILYDFIGYKQNLINQMKAKYPETVFEKIPQSVKQVISDKIIEGVECKFGLYINDNPIVERLFYVNGYNPIAKSSIDLVYVIEDICDKIFEYLKKIDVKHMWDDYDLINKYSMSIYQIRELPKNKREDLIRKMV